MKTPVGFSVSQTATYVTRMRGYVGAEGEKPLAIRLGFKVYFFDSSPKIL